MRHSERSRANLPWTKMFRRSGHLLVALLLSVLGGAFALEGAQDQTILQGLQGQQDQFSTFLELVQEAGLTHTLEDPGPITVLAPTNAAFNAMDAGQLADLRADPAQLQSLVNGLILSGRHTVADLEGAVGTPLVPLSGEAYDLRMENGALSFNGVALDATDVDREFSNGIVHVTDQVILPQGLSSGTATGAAPAKTDAATAAAATAATTATTDTAADTRPAFVRVVQLSPATSVDVMLTPKEEGGSAVTQSDVQYAAPGSYQEVRPGSYLLNVTAAGSQDSLFEAPTETFKAGDYYTVAVMGLQVPAEDRPATDNEGFVGWLRNLFGSEGNHDALAMKVVTYKDDVRQDATDHRVRVIDAAPGSPAFDLDGVTAAGEHKVIAGGMTYGDDSGNKNVPDDVTAMQLTAADSSVVALDLTDQMPLPADATLFIIGTSFEGAPFNVMVLPNGPSAATGTTAQ